MWSWLKKKNIYFNKVTVVRYVKKLIHNDEEKVRDHCHVNGKFRGAAHGICNINLQITKKFPVIFHNLRGYNSHLIFSELHKFDVKIIRVLNGLEKYMAFFLNKNLVLLTLYNLWILALINLLKTCQIKILSTS